MEIVNMLTFFALPALLLLGWLEFSTRKERQKPAVEAELNVREAHVSPQLAAAKNQDELPAPSSNSANISAIQKPGAGRLKAKVKHIIDGDSVFVKHNGQDLEIRLAAIDCPEGEQPWGNTAKAGLIKLIGGKWVEIDIHGQDHYERTIATIFVATEKRGAMVNVNERMVQLGHAWVMPKYCDHLSTESKSKLIDMELWSKSNRIGLWREKNPIKPWLLHNNSNAIAAHQR